jgi:hypothetical protein
MVGIKVFPLNSLPFSLSLLSFLITHTIIGLLVPGSVQWMTAGRGIIHSEMPKQENGLMWGFQLWINLPAAQKMVYIHI